VDLVLFPLDTIKTRIQATIKGTNLNFVENSAKVSKYAGLKSQVFASFPAAAAFFSTYDFTKYFFKIKLKVEKKYDPFVHMLAAVLGEAAQVMFRNPFELIKQNMQIGKYKTMSEAIMTTFTQNGIKGFYRGYFVTVFREIPFGLIQYPLYERLKHSRRASNKYGETFSYCLCGAQAGGIAAFLTTPIDVVKTRIMTTSKGDSFDIKKIIPKVKSIYANEGAAMFFSGVHVRVAYISIGGMIFFGANEYFKKLIAFDHL